MLFKQRLVLLVLLLNFGYFVLLLFPLGLLLFETRNQLAHFLLPHAQLLRQQLYLLSFVACVGLLLDELALALVCLF